MPPAFYNTNQYRGTFEYIPLLHGSSKAPLDVYYAYFLDWQGLPDIARAVSDNL